MTLTFRKPGAKEGKPLNKLQQLASSENFAIFTVKGMLGNLNQLKRCPSVPQSTVLAIEKNLQGILLKVKHEQKQRKLKREQEKSNG